MEDCEGLWTYLKQFKGKLLYYGSSYYSLTTAGEGYLLKC